jgi:hypothetical protein
MEVDDKSVLVVGDPQGILGQQSGFAQLTY